jgi:peptide deformylase
MQSRPISSFPPAGLSTTELDAKDPPTTDTTALTRPTRDCAVPFSTAAAPGPALLAGVPAPAIPAPAAPVTATRHPARAAGDPDPAILHQLAERLVRNVPSGFFGTEAERAKFVENAILATDQPGMPPPDRQRLIEAAAPFAPQLSPLTLKSLVKKLEAAHSAAAAAVLSGLYVAETPSIVGRVRDIPRGAPGEVDTLNPVLREHAAPVTEITSAVRQLAADLVATVVSSSSTAGIAAPQIGTSQQMIVVNVSSGVPRVLLNPRIGASGDAPTIALQWEFNFLGREGCKSLTTTTYVRRSYWVDVEAMDIDGRPVRLHAEGFLSRVLQHEIDHLNGVLISDYANSGTPS